jgi:hypothetical protein
MYYLVKEGYTGRRIPVAICENLRNVKGYDAAQNIHNTEDDIPVHWSHS